MESWDGFCSMLMAGSVLLLRRGRTSRGGHGGGHNGGVEGGTIGAHN